MFSAFVPPFRCIPVQEMGRGDFLANRGKESRSIFFLFRNDLRYKAWVYSSRDTIFSVHFILRNSQPQSGMIPYRNMAGSERQPHALM